MERPTDLVSLRRFMLDRGIDFEQQMNNHIDEWRWLWDISPFEAFVRNLPLYDIWCDNVWLRIPHQFRTWDALQAGIDLYNTTGGDEITIIEEDLDGWIWIYVWWD